MLGLRLGIGFIKSVVGGAINFVTQIIESLQSRGTTVENIAGTTAELEQLETDGLLNSAKLILNPSSVSNTVMHSSVPLNGFGDFPITRSTIATRLNEQGFLVDSPINEARIDFVDGVGRYVAEKTKTNQWEFSDFPSNWVNAGISLAGVGTISPDGVSTAQRLTPTVSNAIHRSYVAADYDMQVGLNTLSFFVKKGTEDEVRLSLNTPFSDSEWSAVQFNLTTLTYVTAQRGTSVSFKFASIEDYKNGWYRVSITAETSVNSLFGFLSFASTPGFINTNDSRGTENFLGDDSKYFYAYGAQLEKGELSSYISSGSTPTTRGSDIFGNVTIPTLFGANEGGFFLELKSNERIPETFRGITLVNRTTSQMVQMLFWEGTGADDDISIAYNAGSGIQYPRQNVQNSVSQQYNKIACYYNRTTNNLITYINGNEISNLTLPLMDFNFQTCEFTSFTTSWRWYGYLKEMIIFGDGVDKVKLKEYTEL